MGRCIHHGSPTGVLFIIGKIKSRCGCNGVEYVYSGDNFGSDSVTEDR